MNKRKAGIAFVILGAVLILSALLLFLRNWEESEEAGDHAEQVLQAITDNMVKVPPKTTSSDIEEAVVPEVPAEMTTMSIDGYDYIGYLEIPSLDLELPVMSDWDYDRMKIAPCRQFGSTKTDDLVIAGHNYRSHFGTLSGLKVGDRILFTDMDGTEWRYTVSEITTLQPTDVDAVQNSGYDLVLYTCTPGGASRVVIYCGYSNESGENAS